MFGYVIANGDKLSDEQKTIYGAEYCGVCKAIGRRWGQIARTTLTYDMTFLSLLLSSVYAFECTTDMTGCLPRWKKHPYRIGKTQDYAADMNVLLAYYNLLDDWNDDRRIFSLAEAKLIKKAKKKIAAIYPRQSEAIRACLTELSEREKANEMNPDIPSGIFGRLMGELFVMEEDGSAPALRAFGHALGRFIYIMDACLDHTDDIRKKHYNPLISMTRDSFDGILEMLMGECAERFEALPVGDNREILENIIYSGVWTRYEEAKRKAAKRK